ncbi:unnamed protein product [Lampetra fluviatilis]
MRSGCLPAILSKARRGRWAVTSLPPPPLPPPPPPPPRLLQQQQQASVHCRSYSVRFLITVVVTRRSSRKHKTRTEGAARRRGCEAGRPGVASPPPRPRAVAAAAITTTAAARAKAAPPTTRTTRLHISPLTCIYNPHRPTAAAAGGGGASCREEMT